MPRFPGGLVYVERAHGVNTERHVVGDDAMRWDAGQMDDCVGTIEGLADFGEILDIAGQGFDRHLAYCAPGRKL